MTEKENLKHLRIMASIARRLDGPHKPLAPAEEKVVDEVRSDEAWLGAMMDVDVPAEVLQRAYTRMHETLALQQRPVSALRRFWRPVAAGVAAAAAIVAAVVVMFIAERGPVPAATASAAATAEEVVEAYLAESRSVFDAEVAALDDEVTYAWMELTLEDEFTAPAGTLDDNAPDSDRLGPSERLDAVEL